MDGRRRYDETSTATHIEAEAQTLGRIVADRGTVRRVGEVQVSATAAGDDRIRRRERSVEAFKLGQRVLARLAVADVDIQDPHARLRTACDPDAVALVRAVPPALDGGGVGGGLQLPLTEPRWVLATRLDWDDLPSTLGVSEGGGERHSPLGGEPSFELGYGRIRRAVVERRNPVPRRSGGDHSGTTVSTRECTTKTADGSAVSRKRRYSTVNVVGTEARPSRRNVREIGRLSSRGPC